MRLAYLTTAYPAVSHTFIRREIVELERRGHHVLRLSIRRSGGSLVDAVDQAEAPRTHYVLEQGTAKLLADTAKTKLTSPGRYLCAVRMMFAMSRRSDRGLVRHAAYLLEACHLLDVLRREKIQHVHVHFGTNAAAVARLVHALGGPRYSMTVHGPDEFDAAIGLSLGDKIADSAFTVGISRYTAGQLRRWVEPRHWERIHVVHATIGGDFADEPPPIDAASHTLVCVGRLTGQKGQLLLLDAVHRLVNRGVEVRLVLAGDGEMRPQVERRMAELSLHEHVKVTGWVSGGQVRQLLRESRAMVLPSFAEGLPVVIMEALAMARPVISTFVAGIPELVHDGVNGWLVPAGDVDALAAAMERALSTPAARLDEMGRAGRQEVLREHATATEVDKLESLFAQAVAQAQPRVVTA